MPSKENTFKVVTYNIHHCRGTDGRYDPSRIANLLKSMKADVIGLQEIDTNLMVPLCERRHEHHIPYATRSPSGKDPCKGLHQLDYLSDQLTYKSVAGLMERGIGEFGNAILTPHPITAVRNIDLSVRGAWERRSALDVDIMIRGRAVRVIVAHLGLEIWERYFQISRLLKAIGPDREQRIVIMGDFNLLVSFLPKLRRFNKRLGHTPICRTFPSFWPLLPLDRIWAQPASSLLQVETLNTPLTRKASDHLPLMGTLLL